MHESTSVCIDVAFCTWVAIFDSSEISPTILWGNLRFPGCPLRPGKCLGQRVDSLETKSSFDEVRNSRATLVLMSLEELSNVPQPISCRSTQNLLSNYHVSVRLSDRLRLSGCPSECVCPGWMDRRAGCVLVPVCFVASVRLSVCLYV